MTDIENLEAFYKELITKEYYAGREEGKPIVNMGWNKMSIIDIRISYNEEDGRLHIPFLSLLTKKSKDEIICITNGCGNKAFTNFIDILDTIYNKSKNN